MSGARLLLLALDASSHFPPHIEEQVVGGRFGVETRTLRLSMERIEPQTFPIIPFRYRELLDVITGLNQVSPWYSPHSILGLYYTLEFDILVKRTEDEPEEMVGYGSIETLQSDLFETS